MPLVKWQQRKVCVFFVFFFSSAVLSPVEQEILSQLRNC